MTKTTLVITLGSLIAAHTAYADSYMTDETNDSRPSAYSYGWREPTMYSQIGIGFTVGGGVSGFTDQSVRDATDTRVGGLWTARVVVGTHIPLGLDVAYNGSAVDLASIAGTSAGRLVGTNAEAALRWNILPHNAVTPFIFAGAGWQRYDVTNSKLATADTGIATSDNIVVYPTGAGIAYRAASGLVLDVRGTMRFAQSSTLIRDASGATADLHSWDAAGNMGYEF